MACFREMPQVLLNLKVREKKPFSKMKKVCAAIEQAEKALEGKGRLLVRYSGTESIARIMVETANRKQCEKLAEEIKNAFLQEGIA